MSGPIVRGSRLDLYPGGGDVEICITGAPGSLSFRCGREKTEFLRDRLTWILEQPELWQPHGEQGQ